MDLTGEQISGFGVALNEAALIGAEINTERRCAAITLGVLTLPADGGPEPEDSRVQLILSPVSRFAASLRMGNWDDPDAEVRPFEPEQLTEILAGFNQQPIYGWTFLDVPEKDDFKRWKKRASLDWQSSEPDGAAHTLDLFQEWGTEKHLDLRFWFDTLRIFKPDQTEIPLQDFIGGGVRWWDAMYAGDSRTDGHGIAGLASGSAPAD